MEGRTPVTFARAATISVLASLACAPCLAYAQEALTGSAALIGCEDPSAAGWVVEASERLKGQNLLAQFAIARFGEPMECRGRVQDQFDGAEYGVVRLVFHNGVSLALKTMPIETMIVSLERREGIPLAEDVALVLRQYAESLGLEIDWTTSERSTDGELDVETFWDPTPGLNASALFRRVSGRLIEVRLSMAL